MSGGEEAIASLTVDHSRGQAVTGLRSRSGISGGRRRNGQENSEVPDHYRCGDPDGDGSERSCHLAGCRRCTSENPADHHPDAFRDHVGEWSSLVTLVIDPPWPLSFLANRDVELETLDDEPAVKPHSPAYTQFTPGA